MLQTVPDFFVGTWIVYIWFGL